MARLQNRQPARHQTWLRLSRRTFRRQGTHIVLTPGNFFDEGGFKHKGDKEKWYRGPILPDYVLNEGDIILAMTEQAEGLLGSSAIIPRSDLYLHNQRLGYVDSTNEHHA